MAPLTKKLSYQNADEWMEKISEMLWAISNNKWIKLKFELENDVAGIAKREISIHLQNVLRCLKFLIKQSGF